MGKRKIKKKKVLSKKRAQKLVKKIKQKHAHLKKPSSQKAIKVEGAPVRSFKEKNDIKALLKRVSANVRKTDYDRILEVIETRGTVVASALQKELNIPKKSFEEYYTVLAKNGAIKIEYPIFGKMKLVKK